MGKIVALPSKKMISLPSVKERETFPQKGEQVIDWAKLFSRIVGGDHQALAEL